MRNLWIALTVNDQLIIRVYERDRFSSSQIGATIIIVIAVRIHLYAEKQINTYTYISYSLGNPYIHTEV